MSCANEVPSQLLQQNVPEEPPSWESSEDVLASFDDLLESIPGPSVSSDTLPTAKDMLAALSEPTGSSILTAEEPVNRKSSLRSRPPRDRRQQQNSHAQRRFRQRQKFLLKAIIGEAEDQVAGNEVRIQDLKERQRQLEARNALLEKFAKLTQSDASDLSESQGDLCHLTTASGDAQETITLTVWGDQVLVRSAQDVGAMPFTEFATIYAVYAERIGHCLAKVFQDEADPALQRCISRWTCQCSSLLVFLAVGNMKKFLSFTISKLDGTVGTSATQLADVWYEDLLAALKLTEAQQVDVMYLRQLFYARLGSLSRERKELVCQAPLGAIQATPQASTRLAAIGTLAQQLQDNSATEIKIYKQQLSAYRRGILTDTQQAACIVRAFPYISEDLRLLEALAAQRNEVPVSALTHAAGLSDFDHEINWLQVPIYLNKPPRKRLSVADSGAIIGAFLRIFEVKGSKMASRAERASPSTSDVRWSIQKLSAHQI
ncbi:hypothetical protein WJX77_003606 [Trebouxia sp. C0004]